MRCEMLLDSPISEVNCQIPLMPSSVDRNTMWHE